MSDVWRSVVMAGDLQLPPGNWQPLGHVHITHLLSDPQALLKYC